MRAPSIAARRLRLTLEEPVETPDGIGGVTRAFSPRLTLWARLEPVNGDERADAQRAGAVVSHRVTLRWRADVSAAMRFRAGEKIYTISAHYDPDGRRRYLVCLVREVQP